ncbi:MAG: LysR family transcriptional regulator [Bryobacteraceae bacterium]|nr:LysR family transcriptional regulator [Bryobacteraceae bacterium]
MNLQAVDLNLLLALEALLEERNVSRAARRLGLSQPAMSNALARLRGLLDDPLFVRAPGGVAPTPRAERMAGLVRAGLDQFRRALDGGQDFNPKNSTRTFRIALSDHAEWLLAPKLMGFSLEDAPGIRVQLKRLDALFVLPEGDLRTGAIDLAIGFFPDARSVDEMTRLETLAEEQHVVVMRRGHTLAGRPLTLAEYAAAPHAAVIYKPEPWGLIDQELAARGLRRNLRLASPHFLTVMHTVAGTDLIATVPESLASALASRLRLEVQDCPLPLPVFATRVAWHAQVQSDPAIGWLLSLLRNRR